MIKKRGTFNNLKITRYNIAGLILLLPVISVLTLDIIARLLQGDLFHYNRAVYGFLSRTPIYRYPVLFTWVIIFPALAVIFNLIPLLRQLLNKKTRIKSVLFIKRNIFSLLLVMAGSGILAVIKLHDFVPCMANGFLSKGIKEFLPLLQYCRNA